MPTSATNRRRLLGIAGTAALACLLFSAAQRVHAQQKGQLTLSPDAQRQLKLLDRPIVLRGDYFQAVQAAYVDFAGYLASKSTSTPPSDLQGRKLIKWLSNIGNYDIHVSEQSTSYVVEFEVSLRNGAPPTFGGGMRYLVDRASHRITEKDPSK